MGSFCDIYVFSPRKKLLKKQNSPKKKIKQNLQTCRNFQTIMKIERFMASGGDPEPLKKLGISRDSGPPGGPRTFKTIMEIDGFQALGPRTFKRN